jgi:hypothetical protein
MYYEKIIGKTSAKNLKPGTPFDLRFIKWKIIGDIKNKIIKQLENLISERKNNQVN